MQHTMAERTLDNIEQRHKKKKKEKKLFTTTDINICYECYMQDAKTQTFASFTSKIRLVR